MSERTWGDAAQTVIMSVLRDHFRGVLPNPGEHLDKEAEARLRDALRAAYPFGERKYHPYKIWLREVKKVMDILNPGKACSAATGPGRARDAGLAMTGLIVDLFAGGKP